MKIIITTFMRESKKEQKAVWQIPVALHEHVVMFTREDRVESLRAVVPETVSIVGNPMDIDGIADIRQRCIDAVPKGKVWVIDDLCTFTARNEEFKSIPMTDDLYVDLYNFISEKLDKYMQVGISARAGNNRVTDNGAEIGRCYTTYGLRTDQMAENDIRFDGMYQKNKNIKLYEDYYITLSMLSKGYKNYIIYDYMFNYNHNKTGGNSTFRNLELQNAATLELQKHFPSSVKIITKEGSWGANGSNMVNRKEPTIQWKKTYMQHVTSQNTTDLAAFF